MGEQEPVLGNLRAASFVVDRTFEGLGIAVPTDDTLLVHVVPSYPSPESKDQLRFALETTIRGGLLTEMPYFELHEITTYGELVRQISGGIPPSAYLCPRGEVYFINTRTCPTHGLPLTAI